MRTKATNLKELSELLHSDFRIYFDFERVYGSINDPELINKRNAISSLISELVWHDSFEEVIQAIEKRDLFDDYKNEEVYKYMLRYMRHNTVSA